MPHIILFLCVHSYRMRPPGGVHAGLTEKEIRMPFRPSCRLLVLFTAVLMRPGPASADPQIGKPAPDFTARDTGGQRIALSGLRGKYVVLEWTNDGCPFVRKHYGS